MAAAPALARALGGRVDSRLALSPERIDIKLWQPLRLVGVHEGLVSAFEQRFPAIDVDLIHIPSQGDYRTRLGADFTAGTPADIVLINYRRYVGFAAKGVLEPLGPYLARSKVIKESDFYPEALQPFYWQNTLMCISQNLSSLVVYYNKSLFDQTGVAYPKAGWTWDDFLKTAKALTKEVERAFYGEASVDQAIEAAERLTREFFKR